jgi:hypothetical protein
MLAPIAGPIEVRVSLWRCNVIPGRRLGAARRRGQTFFRREDGNWGLINLQKSTSSTRQLIRFTVNVGIFSERIGSAYRAPSGGPPRERLCHYRERIGYLLPVRQDYWWTIDASA